MVRVREYTVDAISGPTVMKQMRSLIKTVVQWMNDFDGDIEEVRQLVYDEVQRATLQENTIQGEVNRIISGEQAVGLAKSVPYSGITSNPWTVTNIII